MAKFKLNISFICVFTVLAIIMNFFKKKSSIIDKINEFKPDNQDKLSQRNIIIKVFNLIKFKYT